MGAHAILSPSSAERWLNCPAAPRLEEQVEDTGSVFAEEGTLAHAICESKLLGMLNGKDPDTAYREEFGEPWTANDLYQYEMEGYTDDYVERVWEAFMTARLQTRDAQLRVEVKLDLGLWLPEGFGTCDAAIIADGTLEIYDFKYGKGVEVSAVDNKQMKIYALGAYDLFSNEYNITRVKMGIIQPRLYNFSTWAIEADELLEWGDEIKPKALLAWKGGGDQVPGKWCKFCAVRQTCRALANKAKEMPKCEPATLSIEEVASILEDASIIKAWCTALEEYAAQKAIEGERLPGYKLVEGRSIRKVTDPEELARKLREAGFEGIFKPMELKTLTNLEGMVGKKAFKEIAGDLVVKPEGKPTLVPESDKRKAMNLGNSAEDDFKNINI